MRKKKFANDHNREKQINVKSFAFYILFWSQYTTEEYVINTTLFLKARA